MTERESRLPPRPARLQDALVGCNAGEVSTPDLQEAQDNAGLEPRLFQVDAGYFPIQLAGKKKNERVYMSIGRQIQRDATSLKKVMFDGVENPLD